MLYKILTRGPNSLSRIEPGMFSILFLLLNYFNLPDFNIFSVDIAALCCNVKLINWQRLFLLGEVSRIRTGCRILEDWHWKLALWAFEGKIRRFIESNDNSRIRSILKIILNINLSSCRPEKLYFYSNSL